MGLQTSMYDFTLTPMHPRGVQIMDFVDKNHQNRVWAQPTDTNEAKLWKFRPTQATFLQNFTVLVPIIVFFFVTDAFDGS